MMTRARVVGLADFGSHALNSLRMEKAYLTRVERWSRWTGRLRWPRRHRLAYLEVEVPDGPEAADCLGGEAVFRAMWR